MSRFKVRCLVGVLVAGMLVGNAGLPGAGADPERQDDRSARYLVKLRDQPGPGRSVATASREIDEVLEGTGLAPGGGAVLHRYSETLSGFAAVLSPRQAAALRADPLVELVEPDRPIKAFDQVTPFGVDRVAGPDLSTPTAIPALSINSQDDVRVDADIAILDTGIALHPDLNVVGATTCLSASGQQSTCTDASPSDSDGHGTFMAGVAAAIDDSEGVVGVAPGARLWSVSVLDDVGSGFASDVLAGIEWVTGRADVIDVVNMSFGASFASSVVVDDAIARSVDRGLVYVVAAGNDGTDVAGTFLANHPDVITVSAAVDFDGVSGGVGRPPCYEGHTDAVNVDDTSADFSNNGNRIDVTAPGTCVISTTPGGFAAADGTSVAAPHVAGAVTLLVAKSKPTDRAGVLGVRGVIEATGNLGWTDTSGDGFQEPFLDVSSRSYQVGSGPTVTSACPATTAAPAGFADVATTNVHRRSVDCAVTLGVARGRSATTYFPGQPVSRAQMATFVAQAVEASGTTLTVSRDHFDDDDGTTHEVSINKLAEAGIVRGVPQGGFAPEAFISRAQMTTFLVNAHDDTVGRALRSTFDAFTDDTANIHEANIDAAAQAGFALGVGGASFEPTENVRRDQMASFLVRLLRRLVAAAETG